MHHPIDHSVLRKAAEDLLTIRENGYSELFQREYSERVSELPVHFRSHHHIELRRIQLRHTAKLLAEIVGIDEDAAMSALFEAGGELQPREVALEVLATMAGEIRQA